MILFTCKYITTHLKQLVLVTAPPPPVFKTAYNQDF